MSKRSSYQCEYLSKRESRGLTRPFCMLVIESLGRNNRSREKIRGVHVYDKRPVM